MYSGTTISKDSGKITGVHQKIDRAARRSLKIFMPKSIVFPNISAILYFEGNNGPDGIKRKSPSVDEPWHYINPSKPDDRALIGMINDHIYNLSEALKINNGVRAAFEAAWLAHAVVDGLTPAHHYPLEDKIEELWGKPYTERNSIKDKGIIKGDGKRDTLSKNWEYWGFGGVLTTHAKFEFGVATAITPISFKGYGATRRDIVDIKDNGFEQYFIKLVQKIDEFKMYDELTNDGWTVELATKIKDVLIPEMIKAVALAWYQATIMATEAKS